MILFDVFVLWLLPSYQQVMNGRQNQSTENKIKILNKPLGLYRLNHHSEDKRHQVMLCSIWVWLYVSALCRNISATLSVDVWLIFVFRIPLVAQFPQNGFWLASTIMNYLYIIYIIGIAWHSTFVVPYMRSFQGTVRNVREDEAFSSQTAVNWA